MIQIPPPTLNRRDYFALHLVDSSAASGADEFFNRTGLGIVRFRVQLSDEENSYAPTSSITFIGVDDHTGYIESRRREASAPSFGR